MSNVSDIADRGRPVSKTGNGAKGHYSIADEIHVDIDASQINKNVRVDLPIVADAAKVLREFLHFWKTQRRKVDRDALAAWWKEIEAWRSRACLNFRNSETLIKPQFAIDRLYALTRGRDVYITTEVGQHQMWAAQRFKFEEPHRWMTSGGLGTMGYGLPAAVGVQVAHPDALVIDIAGEASVQMTMQEMSTAVQHRLPIKVFILNNKYMGMVRQWQQFFYGNRYAESYMDALPDFTKLAEAFGHVGMKVERPGDVEGALTEAFKLKDRLVFLDMITDQAENVFPMVPGGKGLTEMILAEEL